MRYYFIPSYPSLFYVLYDVTYSNDKIVVISSNQSIIRLFDEYGIQTIRISAYVKPHHSYSLKKELDSILQTIVPDSEFRLFDHAFCVEGFYLAARWPSKKASFTPPEVKFLLNKGANKKKSIKFSFSKLIVQKLLNIKLSSRIQSGKPTLAIDDSYLKQYNIETYKYNIGYQDLVKEIVIKYQISQQQVDYMFIAQGSLHSMIEPDSLWPLIKSTILPLNNIATKPHPKHHISENLSLPNPLPDYIPAEFLLGNVQKAVISVFSLTLINATWFSNIKAISLLELVEWKDISYKNKVRTLIIERGNGKILLPKTIKELKELLS